MPARFDFNVFLSHNSLDKPRVRRLAERLRDAGLRVWFDEWQIKPGDDIYLAVERGLEASRVLLLFLSPAALESDWVGLERSTVLFRDPSNAGRRFIPVLLVDCKLPDTLRRYKYVDFRLEADSAFAEMLTASQPEAEATARIRPPKPEEKAKPDKKPDRDEPWVVLERKIETGHWIWDLAISPDSRWLAAAQKGANGAAIFDMMSGARLGVPEGHQGERQGRLHHHRRQADCHRIG